VLVTYDVNTTEGNGARRLRRVDLPHVAQPTLADRFQFVPARTNVGVFLWPLLV